MADTNRAVSAETLELLNMFRGYGKPDDLAHLDTVYAVEVAADYANRVEDMSGTRIDLLNTIKRLLPSADADEAEAVVRAFIALEDSHFEDVQKLCFHVSVLASRALESDEVTHA